MISNIRVTEKQLWAPSKTIETARILAGRERRENVLPSGAPIRWGQFAYALKNCHCFEFELPPDQGSHSRPFAGIPSETILTTCAPSDTSVKAR